MISKFQIVGFPYLTNDYVQASDVAEINTLVGWPKSLGRCWQLIGLPVGQRTTGDHRCVNRGLLKPCWHDDYTGFSYLGLSCPKMSKTYLRWSEFSWDELPDRNSARVGEARSEYSGGVHLGQQDDWSKPLKPEVKDQLDQSLVVWASQHFAAIAG